MTQQLLQQDPRERPALIAPIALIAFAYAIVLLVGGALSIAGRMSLHLGAESLGSGLEVMGPPPYFLYAIALATGASGLSRAKNWARRVIIVLCAAGVFLTVPHISSAVMDERWLAMSFDGLQILLRVAVASYLLREAQWFRSPQ
jgi:hypothetical protein